jgi:probable addiction module antidote protein
MEKTYRWDPASHIKTKEDAIGVIEAALEENDPELLFQAIGDIARSRGMTEMVRELNLSRESLYRSFSRTGNPLFTTVVKLLDILGYRIEIRQKTA